MGPRGKIVPIQKASRQILARAAVLIGGAEVLASWLDIRAPMLKRYPVLANDRAEGTAFASRSVTAKAKRRRVVVAVLRDGLDVSAKKRRRNVISELRTGTRKPPRRSEVRLALLARPAVRLRVRALQLITHSQTSSEYPNAPTKQGGAIHAGQ
jgi:hypothetical protein